MDSSDNQNSLLPSDTPVIPIDVHPEARTPSAPPAPATAENYFIRQMARMEQLMQQQSAFMAQHMGLPVRSAPSGVVPTVPPSTSLPNTADNAVEVHASDAEFRDEMDDEDGWGAFSRTQRDGDGDASSGDEQEHLISSQYQSLLDQTAEEMGDPLDEALALVAQKTWNKALLSKDKKKSLVKDIRIPSNCPTMKPPTLNTEIYIRVPEQAQNKDRAAQDRQKDVTKAAIPLFTAVGKLSSAQHLLSRAVKKHGDDDTLHTTLTLLNATMPLLQQSIKVLNYHVTEHTRKRRYDVCNSLGPLFKTFAGEPHQSSDLLFGEDNLKKMKSELKKLPVKGAKDSSSWAKNERGSNKTYRSQYQQGNSSRGHRSNYKGRQQPYHKRKSNKKATE